MGMPVYEMVECNVPGGFPQAEGNPLPCLPAGKRMSVGATGMTLKLTFTPLNLTANEINF